MPKRTLRRPKIDYSPQSGGGRGIRTPERVSPLTVFKTAGFNHSPIPPFIILTDSLVCDHVCDYEAVAAEKLIKKHLTPSVFLLL